jgi:hypothetical protein
MQSHTVVIILVSLGPCDATVMREMQQLHWRVHKLLAESCWACRLPTACRAFNHLPFIDHF